MHRYNRVYFAKHSYLPFSFARKKTHIPRVEMPRTKPFIYNKDMNAIIHFKKPNVIGTILERYKIRHLISNWKFIWKPKNN